MLRTAAIALALVLAAGSASAITVTETSDAGRDMASAFVLPAGTTQVNGTIANTTISDVDLYKFSLSSPTALTIRMLFPAGDANLIVFDDLGRGLAGDDDNYNSCDNFSGLGTWDSCLTLNLGAGTFFVAAGNNNIAAFENATLAANGGSSFISNDSGILGAPTTQTLGLIGNSYGDFSLNAEGGYTLEFSSAVGAAVVPLPAAAPLLLGGLAALAGLARRSRARG